MTRRAPITPLHPSLQAGQAPRRPLGLSARRLTAEDHAYLQEQALAVFTTAVNAGVSFQQALAAIYLTGLDHGRGAAQDAERSSVDGDPDPNKEDDSHVPI